jgi:hypothetical protein
LKYIGRGLRYLNNALKLLKTEKDTAMFPTLEQRLVALQRTLAEATTLCPCFGKDMCKVCGVVEGYSGHHDTSTNPDDPCLVCQGTGEVARFPEDREYCPFCGGDTTSPCEDCDDRHYMVRAGDSADGLAGLSVDQAQEWVTKFETWLEDFYVAGPMPSALEIRVKELELIRDAAGLEEE